MTAPTYTLDHVRAALGDYAADKVRDYMPPPPVSPELRLARECAAKAYENDGNLLSAEEVRRGDDDLFAPVQSALLALQRRHELDTAVGGGDADGWIAWHGGECPVPPNTRPAVSYRLGIPSAFYKAIVHDWDHYGVASDIIAYKPEPGK